MVDMVYVDSTNVDQVGYDPDAMELHVIFKDGGAHYLYRNVPPIIYDELLTAPSKGSYLNREIKSVYEYSKL